MDEDPARFSLDVMILVNVGKTCISFVKECLFGDVYPLPALPVAKIILHVALSSFHIFWLRGYSVTGFFVHNTLLSIGSLVLVSLDYLSEQFVSDDQSVPIEVGSEVHHSDEQSRREDHIEKGQEEHIEEAQDGNHITKGFDRWTKEVMIRSDHNDLEDEEKLELDFPKLEEEKGKAEVEWTEAIEKEDKEEIEADPYADLKGR